MKINLNNIFYVLLNFGSRQVKKTVVAINKEEVIITINDYYDEPEIVSVISVQEMMDFLHLIEQKNNLLIIVLEAIIENDKLVFIHHEESNPNKKEIKEKYKDKKYMVFTKDFLNETIKDILIDLPSVEEKMLLSDTFLNMTD